MALGEPGYFDGTKPTPTHAGPPPSALLDLSETEYQPEYEPTLLRGPKTSADTATIGVLLARIRGEVETLPEPLRKAIANLVSDYLKTPDAATGQDVAAAIERIINRKPP